MGGKIFGSVPQKILDLQLSTCTLHLLASIFVCVSDCVLRMGYIDNLHIVSKNFTIIVLTVFLGTEYKYVKIRLKIGKIVISV